MKIVNAFMWVNFKPWLLIFGLLNCKPACLFWFLSSPKIIRKNVGCSDVWPITEVLHLIYVSQMSPFPTFWGIKRHWLTYTFRLLSVTRDIQSQIIGRCFMSVDCHFLLWSRMPSRLVDTHHPTEVGPLLGQRGGGSPKPWNSMPRKCVAASPPSIVCDSKNRNHSETWPHASVPCS